MGLSSAGVVSSFPAGSTQCAPPYTHSALVIFATLCAAQAQLCCSGALVGRPSLRTPGHVGSDRLTNKERVRAHRRSEARAMRAHRRKADGRPGCAMVSEANFPVVKAPSGGAASQVPARPDGLGCAHGALSALVRLRHLLGVAAPLPEPRLRAAEGSRARGSQRRVGSRPAPLPQDRRAVGGLRDERSSALGLRDDRAGSVDRLPHEPGDGRAGGGVSPACSPGQSSFRSLARASARRARAREWLIPGRT